MSNSTSPRQVQNAIALLKEVGADIQSTSTTPRSPRSLAATRPPAECKTKVNALRRTSLDTLPRLLIIHLKRWMIDYTTFPPVPHKLNSEVTFPIDDKLDMRVYTEQFLDASQDPTDKSSDDEDAPNTTVNKDLYMLKGVIIHQGDVGHGHYFSYIRPDMDSSGTAGTEWFEFNDHRVKPFQTNDLAAACFGGRRPGRKTETSSNAYLLLYERVCAEPLIERAALAPTLQESSCAMATAAKQSGRLVTGRVRYGAEVEELNISTARHKILFDLHLFQFFEHCLLRITEQCCSGPATAEVQSVTPCFGMLVDFYLEVVLRTDKAERPSSDVERLAPELLRCLNERHRHLQENGTGRRERGAAFLIKWVIDTFEDLAST